MIYVVFPVAVIAVAALYLAHLRAAARRRNAQSWESLVAQLRLDWTPRELNDCTQGAKESAPRPKLPGSASKVPKAFA